MSNEMPLTLTEDHFVDRGPARRYSIRQMINYARSLDEPLSVLLQTELQCGNKILEVAIDWPDAGSIFILLNRRFVGSYQHETFEYRELDDPHYWFAEYATAHRPVHFVCCPWDNPMRPG